MTEATSLIERREKLAGRRSSIVPIVSMKQRIVAVVVVCFVLRWCV